MLLPAAAVLALAACAHSEPLREPQTGPQAEPAPVVAASQPDEHIYDALHWARNSAEHRAIFEQTFALAAERLQELAQGREPGSWAISADADETLVNNSNYEVERSRIGKSFSRDSWNAWMARKEATALPGAVEFTERVRSLGGIVAVVTNRDASHCAPTAENLEAIGIAYDIVLCRAGDEGEKEPRWEALAAGTSGDWPGAQTGGDTAPGRVEVLMWLGDNIGDFPLQNQDVRYSAEPLTDFGDRFFILPNPVYGSWEDNPRR